MRRCRFCLPAGLLALIGGMTLLAGRASAASCPWMNPLEAPAQRATTLLRAMSLADKIQMVTGTGEFDPAAANPEAASTIAANPSLCIPALVLNDATAGVGDQAAVGEPPKQLKGFRRVSLNPGQSTTVTIPLDAMSFAHWDTSQHKWVVSAGNYQVMVGGSSRDIAGQGSVALPASVLGG
jgi:hypothetical protein